MKTRSFMLSLSCDNEAFGDDPSIELARILDRLAASLSRHGLPRDCEACVIRDVNGNGVGYWGFHVTRDREKRDHIGWSTVGPNCDALFNG